MHYGTFHPKRPSLTFFWERTVTSSLHCYQFFRKRGKCVVSGTCRQKHRWCFPSSTSPRPGGAALKPPQSAFRRAYVGWTSKPWSYLELAHGFRSVGIWKAAASPTSGRRTGTLNRVRLTGMPPGGGDRRRLNVRLWIRNQTAGAHGRRPTKPGKSTSSVNIPSRRGRTSPPPSNQSRVFSLPLKG